MCIRLTYKKTNLIQYVNYIRKVCVFNLSSQCKRLRQAMSDQKNRKNTLYQFILVPLYVILIIY